MAEEKERERSEQSITTWGTWEELLLACAVKRHGFKDWNSVAMEVQARSSLPHLLTSARNCELKFLDLKRRFTSVQNDAVLNQNGAGIAEKVDRAAPWVDELRNLRVAELRREVQRYDVSINSLQLKVKKLEEEREQGLNDRDAGTGKPDLKSESRERRSENDKKLFGEPDHRSGPNGTVVKSPAIPGEDSDREDFSVNQSNSTGSKSGYRKSTAENAKSETKPEFSGSYKPNRRTAEPAGPQSDDGSTDTVVKNPTCDTSETKKKKETKRVDDSSELADSEAQSNGGGTATRDSSEVQSSASLTGRMKRKRLFRKEISGGSSGNEPRGTAAVKSRRFDEVLQIIRSHKHGSLFESRLQIQETEEYKGMIRQHLDIETVQAKINSGAYSSSSLAFFRDLLLLFNNVVTFFPKSSKESVAACELCLLVSNEMKKTPLVARTAPSPEVVDSSPVNPSQSKGLDLEDPQSLLAKQKSSVPIIVCRKRSKISSKLSSTGLGEKGDRSNDDEKSAVDLKPSIKMASNTVEDHGTTKDSKVKEKSITGARSMRRSNDSTTNSSGPSIKKQNTNSGWKPSSANETETPNLDKKKPETVALEKKRSAADFLKRIKQNSPAETMKRNGRGSSSSIGNSPAEQKKGSGKSDKSKERVFSTRQSNDKKRPKEEDASPSKRSVGRPPKKAAEADPTPIKRAREGGGKEPLKRVRKRARR